jgi:hypothetical protein
MTRLKKALAVALLLAITAAFPIFAAFMGWGLN